MDSHIHAKLLASADPAYRDFSSALIPGCNDMLGVRIPILRAMAKELCRGEWRSALAEADKSFEERLLRGLVIAAAPLNLQDHIGEIRRFLPQIDNWSVCDSFCVSLKCMQKNPDGYWPLLLDCIHSSEEFTVRFAVVSMLDHYLDTPYLPEILTILPTVQHPGFYVRMAVAWALATAYLRDRETVTAQLKSNTLDVQTHNLTIQKIMDSRRVSLEDKHDLRTLRRKSR